MSVFILLALVKNMQPAITEEDGSLIVILKHLKALNS